MKRSLAMGWPMHFTSIICVSLIIRENLRKEKAHLPAPFSYAGFTLIELSIVLVIVGLLVGGVLVGQDLIKAAQWRGLYSQVQEIETAVRTFEIKYHCIPGDCDNAYQFFGDDCGTNNTGMVLGGCNGNNDLSIGVFDQWGQYTSNSSNEVVKFWTHLFMAGFGPQTNNQNMTDPIYQVGKNIPETNINSVGMTPARTSIVLGMNNPDNGNGYFPHGPFLTPADAKRFDTKFDDGMPYKGRIGGGNGTGGYSGYNGLGPYPCILSGDYEVAQPGTNCYLQFNKLW